MIKQDNKRITLTLSNDLVERLEEYSMCRGISKTSYIRELIEKQLSLDIINLDNTSRSFARHNEIKLNKFRVFVKDYGSPKVYVAAFPDDDLARSFCETYDCTAELMGYEVNGINLYFAEKSDDLEECGMNWSTSDGFVYVKSLEKKISLREFLEKG